MGNSGGKKKPVTFDARRRRKYLDELRKGYMHAAASALAGVSSRTTRRHREKDTDFADAAEQAFNEGTSVLEAEALRRALDPVNGSDTLLIFALKNHGWSDRQQVEHSGTINFHVGGQWMDREPAQGDEA